MWPKSFEIHLTKEQRRGWIKISENYSYMARRNYLVRIKFPINLRQLYLE